MPGAKKVVTRVLVPSLQLSLGLFLIIKTTPLWAVIHCSIAYLLDCCRFPFTDYKQLREFEGRVFKKVMPHTTAAGDVSNLREMNAESEIGRSVSVKYLGQKFVLEQMDGDKMQVKTKSKPKDGEKGRVPSEQKDGEKEQKDGEKDCGPVYYITDKMWETMNYIRKVADEDSVFVKNHKEIWEEVVTGDIMEFGEVLDSVILDNRAVVRLDHDYFLPVNLLLSEDKLRATLNFVGMFLQTQKQVDWAISASLSITAAVMGFTTTLRLSVARWIEKHLCRGVQFVCDRLPYKTRRSVYWWCSWMEGRFKPSNDFHSRIVKGDVEVIIAGGAKFDTKSEIERMTSTNCLGDDILSAGAGGPCLLKCSPNCDSKCGSKCVSNCDSVYIERMTSADCSVDDIFSAGGPYLLKCNLNCDSKCGSKCVPNCDSVYIEWTFDNNKCSLKSGHLKRSRPSLKQCKTSILCGDGNGRHNKEITFYRCNDTHSAISVDMEPSKVKETGKKSMMAVKIHTASVDIDCSAEEAKKLFIFAHYMAELKTGSLRSYERKSGTVYVRRFVESINAYVRSGYPPLHKLKLKNVVVR